MKICEKFGLNPANVDFLNVELNTDTELYLDANRALVSPKGTYDYFLRLCGTFWVKTLKLLKSGRHEDAKKLWSHLKEVKETCLGVSLKNTKGKGVGNEKALWLLDEVKTSDAVRSGKVEDLQDISLFIPGIGPDNVSDVVTNITKKYLIEYTQQQAKLHKIPLTEGYKAFYWDDTTSSWKHGTFALPFDDDNHKFIIFVPRMLISRSAWFGNEWMYQNIILRYEQAQHLASQSELIKRRKDGEAYIPLKDIREYNSKRYGNQKKRTAKVVTEAKENLMRTYKQKLIYALRSENTQYGGDRKLSELGV